MILIPLSLPTPITLEVGITSIQIPPPNCTDDIILSDSQIIFTVLTVYDLCIINGTAYHCLYNHFVWWNMFWGENYAGHLL